MIKFQGKTWVPGVTRNASFFHACLVEEGDEKSEVFWHLPPKDLLHVVLDGKRMTGFFRTDKLKIFESGLDKLFATTQSLHWVKKNYFQHGKALARASELLGQKLTLNSYNNFLQKYTNLTTGLWLTAIAGRHFHTLLLTGLKKNYKNKSEPEIDALVGKITYPSEHTPLMDSQISLLKIGAGVQQKKLNSKKVKELLTKHWLTYRVIPVNYNEDPWTMTDIKDQLKQALSLDCAMELARLRTSHFEKTKEAKEQIKNIKSSKIRHYAQVLQSVTLLNEYRKFVFCEASLAHQDIFKKIAKKYKLKDWRECFKFTPEEIRNLYFFNNHGPLQVLPSRKIAALRYDIKSKAYIFYNRSQIQEFLDFIDPSNNVQQSKATELQGRTANPGIARGKAKIIISKEDFKKFRSGNILIAPMTSVDYVPLMQQAAAFVTNEGGITSHASIVSREMNKPCIIGTKNATKVFKDGDMVEVDANNGIVKILKHH